MERKRRRKGGEGLYEICMSEDGFIMPVFKEF